jgi:hypothetical protein
VTKLAAGERADCGVPAFRALAAHRRNPLVEGLAATANPLQNFRGVNFVAVPAGGDELRARLGASGRPGR